MGDMVRSDQVAPALQSGSPRGSQMLIWQQAEVAIAREIASTYARALPPRGGISFEQASAQNLLKILWGVERGLTPMKAMDLVVVIDGKISVSADGMAALAMGHPSCEWLRVEHNDRQRCVYLMKRRGEQRPHRVEYTMEDAAAAGLANKRNWKNHPRAMLRAACLRAGCRQVFPDAMAGVYTDEELRPGEVEPGHEWAAPRPTPAQGEPQGTQEVAREDPRVEWEAAMLALVESHAPMGRDELRAAYHQHRGLDIEEAPIEWLKERVKERKAEARVAAMKEHAAAKKALADVFRLSAKGVQDLARICLNERLDRLAAEEIRAVAKRYGSQPEQVKALLYEYHQRRAISERVPSNSEEGVEYLVSRPEDGESMRCTCKAASYGGECKHIKAVAERLAGGEQA